MVNTPANRVRCQSDASRVFGAVTVEFELRMGDGLVNSSNLHYR